MIFARKVIEESAFANVSRFRYVLHRRFQKPFLSKELQRRSEKALADLRAPPLAAV